MVQFRQTGDYQVVRIGDLNQRMAVAVLGFHDPVILNRSIQIHLPTENSFSRAAYSSQNSER